MDGRVTWDGAQNIQSQQNSCATSKLQVYWEVPCNAECGNLCLEFFLTYLHETRTNFCVLHIIISSDSAYSNNMTTPWDLLSALIKT
jgi:hypothetical protein